MTSELQVTHLDLDTVKTGMSDRSMLIIDVREPHEFAMGHMPGALSMPLSSFDPDEIPVQDGKRIVFSCAAGVRSMQALAIAQASGLSLSEHYRGGFREWAGMGEEIET